MRPTNSAHWPRLRRAETMDRTTSSPRRRLLIISVLGALIIAGVIIATITLRGRGPVRSVASTCEHLAVAKDLDRSLTSLDEVTLRDRLGALDAAAGTAPAEIRPPIVTLAKFVKGLVDEVDRSAGSDRRHALADALAARADQIDDITAAGAALQTWASSNCGIELGDPSGGSSSIP
jgi:hypothetical protein